MSAFLGKIHYWLYDKIKLQEELIENAAALAGENGYNGKALLNASYSNYGYPVTGPLENAIERDNIHGWLQEKIISVESRLAYVLTELMQADAVKKEDIAQIFYKNGAEKMKQLGISEGTPEEFFNLIFDYMLEGMPCDRVNEVVQCNETMIEWHTTRDIHKEYWEQVIGDVSNYYYFKSAWINGFLSASDAGYEYTRTDNGMNTIKKV